MHESDMDAFTRVLGPRDGTHFPRYISAASEQILLKFVMFVEIDVIQQGFP